MPQQLFRYCRKAYQETRYFWYANSYLCVPSDDTLERFIHDTRSENLALIEDLEMSLMGRRLWPDLAAFHGLKVLQVSQLIPRKYVIPTTDPHPRKAFLRAFVALYQRLPSLQEICFWHVGARKRDAKHFASYSFDLDDIPGWAHSVRHVHRSVWARETLERVHGPHWIEREWDFLTEAEKTDEGVLRATLDRGYLM